MFCTNCGKRLPEGGKFCSGCGRPQNAASAPPAPSAVTGQPQPAQQQTAQPQTGGVYNPPGIMPIPPNNSFGLLPGETLFASHYGARFNPISSAGYLHVTNMRVYWTKSLGGSMLAHGVIVGAALADEAEIPLNSVVSAEDRRVGGSKGGIIIHTGDGKKHLYAVTSKMGTCNAEAGASKSIMLAVLNYAASQNRGMR